MFSDVARGLIFYELKTLGLHHRHALANLENRKYTGIYLIAEGNQGKLC
jgi:hypothetical protein